MNDAALERARTIEFTVPGRPVPAPRPRSRRGQGAYYGSPKYEAWRQAVQVAALNAVGGVRPLHTGVVWLSASFGPHDTTVEVTLVDADAPGRADIDNLLKGLMDALQGILYDNDRRVVWADVARGSWARVPAMLVGSERLSRDEGLSAGR